MFIVHVMCVSVREKNGRQELDTKSASIFDPFSMNLLHGQQNSFWAKFEEAWRTLSSLKCNLKLCSFNLSLIQKEDM